MLARLALLSIPLAAVAASAPSLAEAGDYYELRKFSVAAQLGSHVAPGRHYGTGIDLEMVVGGEPVAVVTGVSTAVGFGGGHSHAEVGGTLGLRTYAELGHKAHWTFTFANVSRWYVSEAHDTVLIGQRVWVGHLYSLKTGNPHTRRRNLAGWQLGGTGGWLLGEGAYGSFDFRVTFGV